MRTTIDLPDDLLRQAKATAALQGISFKDLVASFIKLGLSMTNSPNKPETFGRKDPIPVALPLSGKGLTFKTNEELFNFLDEQDRKPRG